MTSNRMFEHTLLLVESPVIKNIIDKFNISYLVTLATKGFCWKPDYDFSRDKLTMKAISGKRDIRNKIRDQAQWAMQVVIASDMDPAGDFIAYSIAKHLKRFDLNLKRTNIRGLSPHEIHRSIDEAYPFSPSKMTRKLINRYKWSHLIQKIPLNQEVPDEFRHAILAILAVLFGRSKQHMFTDRKGVPYMLETSRLLQYEQHVEVSYSEDREFYYPENQPLNTFDVLDLMTRNLSYKSYQTAQKDLNSLFSWIIDPVKTGLISYPRTRKRAFYDATWQHFENQWIKENSLENFLPRQLRPSLNTHSAHEAIHPLRLKYSPDNIRPYIRKKYYDIYKLIYRHHIDVLNRPEIKRFKAFKGTNTSCFYYQLKQNEKSLSKEKSLIPYFNMKQLIYRLMNYKAIRPSKLGRFADFITSNRIVKVGKYGRIKPGKALFSMQSQLNDADALRELLHIVKKQLDRSFDTDMISRRLSSIFNTTIP